MALTVKTRLGRGRTVETFAATLEVGAERLDVVVKRPRAELAGNQAFVQGLLSWAEAQAELDHDGVVAVLESGRTSEGAYVIQEHVDGVALSAVLATLRKRRRTLSPSHAITLASRVASALAYLAADGRPGHGDLDPGEVLVSYRGEVQVTDARLSDLKAHVGADLVVEEDRGAQAYQAPEVQATSTAGPAADVYALGLALLEMLIGHPVWTAETMTVADAVAALTDFTHIGQASPALTKDLLDLLGRALDPSPEARPSAQVMQEDLQRIQAAHGLDDDELGLGVFVEAILPPREEDDAATQLMSPAQVEALQSQREAAADWDAASVLIDPEIAAKAAAQFGLPRPETPAARRDSSAAGRPIVAAAVPLAEASVTRLEAAAKAVEAAARAEDAAAARADSAGRAGSTPAGGPATPRRPSAASAYEVPGIGSRLRETFDGLPGTPPQRYAALAAVAVLVIVMLGALVGGPELRTVKLRATSEPTAARLFVDGVELGVTPFEQDVETAGPLVELRFELDGYRGHEVSIGTAAGEVRYEARLEPGSEDD